MGVGSFLGVLPSEILFSSILPGGSFAAYQAALQPVSALLPAGAITFLNFTTYLSYYNAINGNSPEM